jgi:flagellar capping protein FliD
MGTPSLLVALLKDDVSKYPSTPLQQHIAEVVDAVEKKQPSLIKDIAQQKLYDALYSLIKDDPQYSIFNKAIGKALENALNGTLASDFTIQALRQKLREEIIAALTPQQPPAM